MFKTISLITCQAFLHAKTQLCKSLCPVNFSQNNQWSIYHWFGVNNKRDILIPTMRSPLTTTYLFIRAHLDTVLHFILPITSLMHYTAFNLDIFTFDLSNF